MKPNFDRKRQLDLYELAILESEMKWRTKSGPLAFVLWWFLGVLGAHHFYLGRWLAGIGKLVLALLIAGGTVFSLFGDSDSPVGLLVTVLGVVLAVWWFISVFFIPRQIRRQAYAGERKLIDEIIAMRSAGRPLAPPDAAVAGAVAAPEPAPAAPGPAAPAPSAPAADAPVGVVPAPPAPTPPAPSAPAETAPEAAPGSPGAPVPAPEGGSGPGSTPAPAPGSAAPMPPPPPAPVPPPPAPGGVGPAGSPGDGQSAAAPPAAAPPPPPPPPPPAAPQGGAGAEGSAPADGGGSPAQPGMSAEGGGGQQS